jgi:hypothetical protein
MIQTFDHLPFRRQSRSELDDSHQPVVQHSAPGATSAPRDERATLDLNRIAHRVPKTLWIRVQRYRRSLPVRAYSRRENVSKHE